MHPQSNPRERTCQRCGKTFLARWPAEKRSYCSRACSDKAQRVPPAKFVTKTCPYCGKVFQQPDWKGHDVTCCSITCAMRLKAQTVVGENHPLWKPKKIMHCEVCGKACEVKPSLVSRFRACSRKCATTLGRRAQRTFGSRIEDLMAAMFADAGLSFQRQRKFWRYRADFAFPDARLVVECDGDYWHSRSDVQRSDRRKDAYLTKQGWRVLRLAETDIKASPGECTERVLHAIDPSLSLMLDE